MSVTNQHLAAATEHIGVDRQLPNRGRSAGPIAFKTWIAPSARPSARTSAHGAQDEALRHELTKDAPAARRRGLTKANSLERTRQRASSNSLTLMQLSGEAPPSRRTRSTGGAQIPDDFVEQRLRDELERASVHGRSSGDRPARQDVELRLQLRGRDAGLTRT